MNTYKIIPDNLIDCVVFADFVEIEGEWMLFYEAGEHARKLVFACSSKFIRFVTLTEE